MAKVQFLGAARTVTGSSYLLEAGGLKILVDHGMFQGPKAIRERNLQPLPFAPSSVDYVLLTHAHIDHSGMIPHLVKQGFRGKILTTRATADLCSVMLVDSGHIQEMEADWKSRKYARAGLAPHPPIYTADDARDSLKYFRGVGYGENVRLNETVSVRFGAAGHILGSAFIEVVVNEEEKPVHIVFSGDVGNFDAPIIRDPRSPEAADILIMESTYGDRLHEAREERAAQLGAIINRTLARNGNVVVPAFAVGRTQEVLYELTVLHEKSVVGHIDTFIDSPLAISATEIFGRHPECFDDETRAMFAQGDDPFDFPGLVLTRSTVESRAINDRKRGALIIAANGMCEAGRILHHLKHNLWRPESTVLFVGYQGEGTLGRRLLDGEKRVKIMGEEIAVKADIQAIHGFSAHADRDGLLRWFDGIKAKPATVFVVHGEEAAALHFAGLLESRDGVRTHVPYPGDSFDLRAEGVVTAAAPVLPPRVAPIAPITPIARSLGPLPAQLAEVESLIRELRTREAHGHLRAEAGRTSASEVLAQTIEKLRQLAAG